MRLNKRILDLFASLSLAMTALSGMAYEKELLALLPPKFSAILTYLAAASAIMLKVLAFFAPPTPSPAPNVATVAAVIAHPVVKVEPEKVVEAEAAKAQPAKP